MYRSANDPGMDPDAVTGYPRRRTGSLGHSPRRQAVPVQGVRQANTLDRSHYVSDPTLLEDKDDFRADRYSASEQGGRRSAMSMEEYSRSEESENMAREAHKVKKKRMKHLRSFMHVFLGGLRRKDGEERRGQGDIASTRDRQRDERDRLARAVANGSGVPPRGEEERRDSSRRRNSLRSGPSPRHGPAPTLELPARHLQLCGLYNHGNTCFMNAVLQCLSNTDQLAEYFVTDAYKGDFNRNSKTPRRLGASGNITEQFALLLKCLWSGQYNPVVSSRFKEVVGRNAEQYQGSAQHDAQEFFLWLLDNIHEDLNQAGKRRYQQLKVGWLGEERRGWERSGDGCLTSLGWVAQCVGVGSSWLGVLTTAVV